MPLRNPITERQIPPSIARDTETADAMAAHLAATDPHLQYPTQVRGDARYVRRYGQSFKAAPTVSQQIPGGVATRVNLPTILNNTGNQFANNRLTALETEVWRLTTYVLFDVPLNTSGRLVLFLYKNGGVLERLMDVTSQGGYWGTSITADVLLNAGEYIEIYATIFASTGGKIYGDTSLEGCWVKGTRVG